MLPSEVLRLLRVTDVLISSDLLAVLMLLRVKDVVLSSDLLAVLRLLRVKDVLLSSDLLTQHSKLCLSWLLFDTMLELTRSRLLMILFLLTLSYSVEYEPSCALDGNKKETSKNGKCTVGEEWPT